MEDRKPELPKGWAWTKVGEIYEIVGGGTPSTNVNAFWEGDIPWITSADISGLKEIKPRRYINHGAIKNSATNLVPEGSLIVVTRVGLGKIALTKVPLCFSQDSQALIGNKFLYSDYSLYLLSTAVQSFKYKHRGTTIAGVTKKQLAELPFLLPPLSEQHRIVAKIEELFTRLDAGVEALKKLKAQLKRYRQAVLKYAFEGKLTQEWREANKDKLEPASVFLERIKEERKKEAGGKFKESAPVDSTDLPELPQGWEWTNVASVGEVVTGTTPSKSKKEYYSKDYPFYKPTDLNDGYYVRKSEDGLSKEGISKARLLPAKSILVTSIGATIGKTGFIRESGASNQQINAIVAEKGILPEYIYFVCISPPFQTAILDNASATTLPILNKSRFELLAIPIPPFNEQQKIVEEIESRFSMADEVEKVAEQTLTQSDRLRQSILKTAFEGKLVPQDPTDEPAEKLLERIKAEKAKKESGTKSRRKKSNQVELI